MATRGERSQRFITALQNNLPWTHSWGNGSKRVDVRISAARLTGDGSLELKLDWRKGGVDQFFSNPWVITGINDLIEDPAGTIIRQKNVFDPVLGEYVLTDVTYSRDPVQVLKNAIWDVAQDYRL